VTVLSLSNELVPRKIEINGYSVIRAHQNFSIASTGFSFSVILRFIQLARNSDIIHYHYPWPFMDIIHLLSRTKKPTIVTYHSDIIRQKRLLFLYRPIQKLFLDSVNVIIATSPNYLKTSRVLGTYANKTKVIQIGLDHNTYPIPSEERKNYWRNKIGPKFFLFIGALRYYKGLHILIEALKEVEYPVVIMGAGPVENELKRHAQCLGLKKIIFIGMMQEEDKTALLTLCYAVLFPSHLRSEAFGISLLEGAMFGKPMISSEIGTGTSYVNISNETGLVIPPAAPLALRDAMRYLWDNPGVAKRMGQSARERYLRLFSSEEMANSYVNVYKELTGI